MRQSKRMGKLITTMCKNEIHVKEERVAKVLATQTVDLCTKGVRQLVKIDIREALSKDKENTCPWQIFVLSCIWQTPPGSLC